MPRRHVLTLIPLAALATSSCAVLAKDSPSVQHWTSTLPEPVSAPVTFESPLVHTSLRPIYARHSFPSDSIFAGGSLTIYALQARLALSERLALIATKDGYFDLDPDAGSSETGLGDIAGGFKYAFVQDEAANLIATGGLVFETTSGDDEVLQGNGDGVLRPFVSAGWGAGVCALLGNLGYNHPLDDDEESTSFDWHLAASWKATEAFVPLVELNGIHYVSSGSALGVDFEGTDVINLGASDVTGHDLVTGAAGLRYRVGKRWWFGVAYEVPLSAHDELFDERITADLTMIF
jgi:hypothetical protein